jgi:hypothetical protein
LTAAANGSLGANLELGRVAFMQRFVDQVDPGRTLPETERQKRAEAARRAYFTALAYRSSVARSRRSERRAPGRGAA